MKKRIIALMAMLTIVAGVLVACGKDPVISDHFPGVYWGESKVGVESAFGDKLLETDLYSDETSTIGVIDAAKLGFPTRDNVELYATYTTSNDALTTICVTYSSENEDDIKAITASLLTFLDDEYGNPKKKDAYSESFVYEWSTNKAYVKLESYGDFGLILTYKAPQK